MNFEQSLKTCYDDAVRFARSLTGSKENGDDLLQDALIRAWRAYPRLRDQDKFKSWLLTIISNTHRSLRRTWWVKRVIGLEEAPDFHHPEGLPYEEKELVRMALQGVPIAMREALVLFEVLGMSVAEVAEHQKVSLSAVKSRLARGRVKLKEQYEKLNKTEALYEADA
ncbi:MAG: RNA polymerase sigma factor, partial [Calditrichaeota bacterium]|nr:RNA polymerase sigma factor [Calditrichota bacterium]